MANGAVVLVVEDEPLVRAMTVDALEDDGFNVLEASTGDYALSVLRQREDIRAVVTDVEMPGQTDGFALAKIARELRPELAIIVVSGRMQPGFGSEAPDALFVSKPFSPTRLVGLVRELISAQA
jgi:two-component system, response regulator PdtaR